MKKWANNSLILCLIFSCKAWSQIDLSPPPIKIIPPTPSPINTEELRKRRNLRQDQSNGQNRPDGINQKKTDNNIPQSKNFPTELKLASYDFGISINLAITKAFVDSPRSDFSSDVTTHFSSYWRLTTSEDKGFWLGFRMAPFSGTGLIHGIPGRFTYTYIGPIFGIGRMGLHEPVEDDPKKALTYEKRKELLTPNSQFGWFLLGGFSVVARKTSLDPSNKVPARDFGSPKGVATDGSGLWLEYLYVNMITPGLSVNYSIGLQTGVGKKFLWLGIALGGWL